MTDQHVNFSGHGLAYEGQGSVPPVPAVIKEDIAGSNPFGGPKGEIAEAFSSWLTATDRVRYSGPALHQLRETLRRHSKQSVIRTIRESFYGTQRAEIRNALEACGLLPPDPFDNDREPLTECMEEGGGGEDTPESLLREAVVHVPMHDLQLRERIEQFLGSRG